MCSKKGLAYRVENTKASARFAKIVSRSNTRAVVLVPGHEGKQYKVILRKYNVHGESVTSAECLLTTGVGDSLCKGNKTVKGICYHSMAAIEAVCVSGNPVWTANREDAIRLSHLGGKKSKVLNHENGSEQHLVLK